MTPSVEPTPQTTFLLLPSFSLLDLPLEARCRRKQRLAPSCRPWGASWCPVAPVSITPRCLIAQQLWAFSRQLLGIVWGFVVQHLEKQLHWPRPPSDSRGCCSFLSGLDPSFSLLLRVQTHQHQPSRPTPQRSELLRFTRACREVSEFYPFPLSLSSGTTETATSMIP